MTVLTVDIGNTNATFGLVRRGKVLVCRSLPTQALSEAGVSRLVRRLVERFLPRKEHLSAVCACSVVASVNSGARRVLDKTLAVPVYFTGKDVVVPIKNLYRKPGQVGQDRLVGAYAAKMLYGPGLVVVDFGTAITFDVVSREGAYLGGLIVPGFRMMQEALERRTALLPYVELALPAELIGRDTKSSIRAGLIYGVAGACDGILARLLSGQRKRFKVVATGGDAQLVRPYTRFLRRIDGELIHKGLALVALKTKLKKNS